MSEKKIPPSRVVPGVAPVRRIVTGHDEQGRSVVASDEQSPHVETILGIPTLAATELWITQVPANNTEPGDPVRMPRVLAPPAGALLLRIVEFPPDRDWKGSLAAGQSLGSAGSNPMMHRTKSVDFAIVVTGEIWAVLDRGEVLMRAGDVLVQRGTNHAWENRSDSPCRVAFVLVDATPIPGMETH